MEDMLPLATYTLSEWSEWSSRAEMLAKAEVCQLTRLGTKDQSKHLCAVLMRPALEVSEKCTDNGGLCLISVDIHSGQITPQNGVFDIAPTGALTVHPERGLVAIGLCDGTCKSF